MWLVGNHHTSCAMVNHCRVCGIIKSFQTTNADECGWAKQAEFGGESSDRLGKYDMTPKMGFCCPDGSLSQRTAPHMQCASLTFYTFSVASPAH